MTHNLNPSENVYSSAYREATTVSSGTSETNKPPGINKHLYSTNPDAIVGENIYADNKTSINREESYQTLDNRTVPTSTGEKVNPFNVKGVPGCKECGGSGWKDSVKNPHPCNECAKRTVPVIDTYLTKVGQTSEASKPTLERTLDVVSREEVEPVRENVQVSYKEPVLREVETTKTVPVTKEVKRVEEVPITTQVPVTRYEEVTKKVPVEKVDYVTENVPVKTTVPVIEEIEKTKVLPITKQELRTGEVIGAGTILSGSEIPPRTDLGTERLSELYKDTHVHDSKLKGTHATPFDVSTWAGIPGCKECGGDGWRRSKLTGGKKPCSHCVKVTGNCPLCGNTGRRLDKDKRCKCQYAR